MTDMVLRRTVGFGAAPKYGGPRRRW